MSHHARIVELPVLHHLERMEDEQRERPHALVTVMKAVNVTKSDGDVSNAMRDVHSKVHHQEQDQRVPVEERAVVEEREDARILVHDVRRDLGTDDVAKDARARHDPTLQRPRLDR